MKNIKKLVSIMLKYWKLMVSGLFTMMVFALLSGVSITMMVPLFDYVFGTKGKTPEINTFRVFSDNLYDLSGEFLYSFQILQIFNPASYNSLIGSLKETLSITEPYLLLTIISIGIILLIVLKNIFFYTNKIIFVTLRGKTVEHLRNVLFDRYLSLSMNFFKNHKIGDIQVRLTSDVTIVSDQFILSFFGSLRSVTLIIIYVLIALLINSKLFFYVIIIVPAFTLSLTYIGGKIKKYSKRIQKTYAILFSKMEEVFNSIKIVKSNSKEKYESEKFHHENHKFYKSLIKVHLYKAVNIPLSELNGTITGVVVLLIGGKMVLGDSPSLTFGGFTAFLFAIFSILHPMKEITKYYTEIKRAMVSLTRIFDILNLEPDVQESINSIHKNEFTSSIKFENVSFAYDSKPVLKNINFEINKGQNIAIVGSSGGGKSTLVNLIERFYDPSEGRITIDGINIKDIKLRDLHDLFGTVTQESILFNDSVENNIKYGTNKKVNIKDVKKAAKIAFADKFINELENNYTTVLSPKGDNLSGGQKQRLCIARAIVGNPPILIFDEATSSLDSEAEQNVQIAIEMATKDRTVIIIAHRLSTILNSDIIVVVDNGKIIGIGKHNELLKTNEKYKILYNIQFNS